MRYALLILIILWSGSAYAQDFSAVALDACELKELQRLEGTEISGNSLQALAQTKNVLNKLQALSDKAIAKGGGTFTETLSKAENAELGRLTHQLSSLQLTNLIYSQRERDFRIFHDWVRLVDQEYRWRRTPSEGDPDAEAFNFILLLRILYPDIEMRPVNNRVCSMGLALEKFAAPVYREGSSERLKTVTGAFNYFTQKYSERPLDPTKMQASDRESFQRWEPSFQEAINIRTFVMDIERLKLMHEASALNSKGKTLDIVSSGGDIKQLGNSVEAWAERKEISQEQLGAIRLWYLVNEKIPHEMLKSSTDAPAAKPEPQKKGRAKGQQPSVK